MLAATLLAGRFLLMPGDYKALSGSAAAAAFGVSNFFFLGNTGYFDQSANLMPLLHTWSLAVEEQFYLVWPVLLFVIARGRARLDVAAILGGIVIIGFAASLVWFDTDPKAAFFMAAPRAWELATGAALVFLPPLPRLLGEIATALGLALIAAGFVLVSDASFPGAAALYPCIGAALLIWPRKKRSTAAAWLGLLSPIGLISYSLYLWHWPVWVMFRVYINNGQPRMQEALALALISVALATLSYFFVEKPFRKPVWQPAQSVQAGLLACILIFCGSMYVSSKEGMPERIPPYFTAMRSLEAMWDWSCDRQKAIPDLEGTWCTFGAPWNEAKTKAVLWGDSHAMHIAPIIGSIAKEHEASIMLYESFPIADGLVLHYYPYESDPEAKKQYASLRQRIIAALQAHPEINLVVLAAQWIYGPHLLYLGDDPSARDPVRGAALFEEAMNDTVKQIQAPGRRIAIITTVPQWSHDPLPCELLNAGVPRRSCPSDQVAIPRTAFDVQLPTVNIIKRVASQHPGTIVIDAGERMCLGEQCVAELNGEPLYRDSSHLRRNLSEVTKYELSKLIRMDRIFH